MVALLTAVVANDRIDRTLKRSYNDAMRTPTTRDPKKNRGRRLAATTRREDIGIVSGTDTIALRNLELESTDYAQREYGATADRKNSLDLATDRRHRQVKRSGKLVTVSAPRFRGLLSMDAEVRPVR